MTILNNAKKNEIHQTVRERGYACVERSSLWPVLAARSQTQSLS